MHHTNNPNLLLYVTIYIIIMIISYLNTKIWLETQSWIMLLVFYNNSNLFFHETLLKALICKQFTHNLIQQSIKQNDSGYAYVNSMKLTSKFQSLTFCLVHYFVENKPRVLISWRTRENMIQSHENLKEGRVGMHFFHKGTREERRERGCVCKVRTVREKEINIELGEEASLTSLYIPLPILDPRTYFLTYVGGNY